MAAAPLNGMTDMGGLASLRLSAKRNDPEALRAAAKQFESLFTQMMLKSARAASLGDDLMGSQQTEFYQDMFDQQVAQQLSAGKGLGIADLLIRQLQATPAASPAPAGLTAGSAVQPAVREPRAGAQDFIQKLLPHAQKAADELGVPARVLVAQAALETGWGRREIRNADGSASHNLFGIKADAGWQGARTRVATHEYVNGMKQAESADFRSYASLDEAFADYARFLKTQPRYREALAQTDGTSFVQGLQKAGYATDPAYADKILGIAQGERMQLALASTGVTTA